MQQQDSIRVLLIGAGYFNRPVAGEKNYYLRLVSEIRQSVGEITVASLNDLTRPAIVQETAAQESVTIYNLRRPFHRGAEARYLGENNGLLHYHHRHSPGREILEKTVAISRHMTTLRRIARGHDISCVVFLDNFGPGMAMTQVALGLPTAFVAANYDQRGRNYDAAQRCFMNPLAAIWTYSDAYRLILRRIGIDSPDIRRIRWGVDPNRLMPLPPSVIAARREELGVAPDTLLGVWSGYIQQIQRDDMLKTLSMAERLIAADSKGHFLFLVKPEFWQPEMALWGSDRISFRAGGTDFREFLGAADFMLSPIERTTSSVSPPLTWLEAMSMGVPVVTTNALAVDEVIEHGVTGLVGDTYDDVESIVRNLLTNGVSEEMKIAARASIETDFNLNNLTREVIEFLQSLSMKKRHAR